MAKPNVVVLFNKTAHDEVNSGNAIGGPGGGDSEWVVMDLQNDVILFLSSQQMNGDPGDGARFPIIIPQSGSLEVHKTFVLDGGENSLIQVPLAGTTSGEQSGGDTRYVFAVFFDGPTASIPYLEAWNNDMHIDADNVFLGDGDPQASTIRAITTTIEAPPSATWAGTPLSGEDSRIALDSGALTGAKNLYFNIKQVIPSTMDPATADVVLSCRYLYS